MWELSLEHKNKRSDDLKFGGNFLLNAIKIEHVIA